MENDLNLQTLKEYNSVLILALLGEHSRLKPSMNICGSPPGSQVHRYGSPPGYHVHRYGLPPGSLVHRHGSPYLSMYIYAR